MLRTLWREWLYAPNELFTRSTQFDDRRSPLSVLNMLFRALVLTPAVIAGVVVFAVAVLGFGALVRVSRPIFRAIDRWNDRLRPLQPEDYDPDQ